MKKNFVSFGLIIVLSIFLAGCTSGGPSSVGSSSYIDSATPEDVQDSDPQVKKSNSDICHGRGTTYYEKTKNFIPFDSIEECLESGGRLPKK